MSLKSLNIIQAIKDENLFRPFLGADLSSWMPWLTMLRCVYGLPVQSANGRQLIQETTGRNPDLLPAEGFQTALFLTGRRCGKSRTSAVIGAYEAVLAGHEAKLAPGEQGMVAVLSPTRYQSRIVTGYIRAIFDTPLLRNELEGETREGFTLKSGVRIEIQAGDWRTIRGYTLLAAIVDEAAFFGYEEAAKVKSDTELIRAVRPALATVGGKLIAISTPYARRGWCYTTYQKNYGNDSGRILVVNGPSRTFNPTLPQSVVDDAMAEDPAAARSEYYGEFRDDVAEFLPRAVIEAVVVKDRKQLVARPDINYLAFADLSGGRVDDAALCVGHREGRTVVVDFLKGYRPPFNPHSVIHEMADEMRGFGVRRVVGDNYAGEFVAAAFKSTGILYRKCDFPKSVLYADLLPRLCSKEIELLDDARLVNQLSSLERRTRAGGKDVIDHPQTPGSHDDLANAVAGLASIAGKPQIVLGAL